MKNKEFKILIDASREKVWNILWDDTTYREWTSVFMPGSFAETDWKKGSKVLFLGPGRDGMVSRIEEIIPNEFLSFKHLGEVKKGVEDYEAGKNWGDAFENYTLKTVEGKTELTVMLTLEGIPEDMEEYFLETWPKAMVKVKEVVERK